LYFTCCFLCCLPCFWAIHQDTFTLLLKILSFVAVESFCFPDFALPILAFTSSSDPPLIFTLLPR
jgi:hypothetical protein